MINFDQTILEIVNHILNQHPELAQKIEFLAKQASKKQKTGDFKNEQISPSETKIRTKSNHEIAIPPNRRFIENLIIQRTDTFNKLGGQQALSTWFSSGDKHQLFEFLRSNNLINRYLQETIDDISSEADELTQNISKSYFKNIVSIGPGNGILELLLYKNTQPERFLLIDIEDSPSHRHGFNNEGSGYASLNDTKNFLVSNGVPENSIMVCNPKNEPLPMFEFDLLISILSMGFHYPCNDYVDFICKNIRQDGWVIFDKRKNVPDSGFETISKALRIYNQITTEKGDRVFFTTPQT